MISPDLAKNYNFMCDNQVYESMTEIEAIKMFIKEQFHVIKKKHCQHFKPIGTTKQQRKSRTSSRTK